MWRGVFIFLCFEGTGAAFFGDRVQAIKELSWLTTRGPNNLSKDMPEELHLMLHTLQESMDLTMTLSPVNTVNMPVYTIHNVEGVFTSTYSEPVNEHCGLYRNKKYSGAFVCRQDEDGQFDIMGTMLIHGKKYCLWPADTNTANKTHFHVLRHVEESHERTTDYLIRNTSTTRREMRAPLPLMTQTYTVELVIYTDYKDYTNFQQRFGLTSISATAEMMSLWYSSIAEFITLTYGTIVEEDPDLNVIVKTIGLVIATIPNASPWADNNIRVDGTLETCDAIDDFVLFSALLIRQGSVPSGDHSMAFSGLVLWDRFAGTSIVGLAFVDALCTDYSVSLNENQLAGFESQIAGHELGHSIGALHDSEEGCSDANFFIMTAFLVTPDAIPDSLLANLVRFSPCSIAKFNTTLQTAACTRQDSNLPTIDRGPSGQLFDADAQCRFIVGLTSRFCREETAQIENCFDSICISLRCINPAVPSQCLEIFPFPRTSCGNGKWCEAGRCVANTEAPATVEGCPQGDDPTAACDAAQCPNYRPDVKSILCCNTCNEPYICPTTTTTTPTPFGVSKCRRKFGR